uniref:C3 and PZP-like alpha-2-macroglobulin domain-containing protein 8 n=1 Tax=Urocitellus parryii TaxID=9999 RepID=A0A8D2IGB4_UROPR
ICGGAGRSGVDGTFTSLLLSSRGYLIAVPSVFRPGVQEVISVTIFNFPKEVTVQAQLVAQGAAVAQSQGAILGRSSGVPTGLRGQALLRVQGHSPRAEEGTLFHNQTSVTVDSRGVSVFIQTDKPVYRPQHRVHISVFTVSPDLRPVDGKDPRGSRVMEWRYLKAPCCGVTNVSFPLSDQPVLGQWSVLVETQGHLYNRSFEVQKYVLPRFELLIAPPPYIRDLDACEKATVQARYTFGKPVSGTLTINMTVDGVGYYSHEVGRPVLRTMKILGSQAFDICVRDLIPVDVPEHFRGRVSIWATVTSVDGSQQVAFDDSTPVQRQLVDVRYSRDTRRQFKPGLAYVGKVELSYPDGSPAEGVTVQVKAELMPRDNIYTREFVSQGGLVRFEIPSIPMSAQRVWLEVFRELEDYDVSDAFGVSREDGASWWAGLTAGRRRRSSAFPWPWGVTKDSGFAFTVRRGNRTSGDDRQGQPEPPAGRQPLHRRGCPGFPAPHRDPGGRGAFQATPQVMA